MNIEFLPQGDQIRQLLTKSNITTANINTLLKEKGVFLGHSEKNNSVPLLTKSIISPNDFEELYSTQKTKEDSEKYQTASIKCIKDFDLSEVFEEKIDLNKELNKRHTYLPNFNVIGNPNFYFEKDNVARIDYKLERENLLNDWTNNKTIHSGSVIIKKTAESGIQLIVEQNSTSKETTEINKILIEKTKEFLNKNHYIDKNEDFITIKFNDFDNSSRIKFFYSFNAKFSEYLEFHSITDIELYLDDEVESHEDVKDFLDEIEKLRLNGKGLQKHMLLYNEIYYPKLIFSSINVKYKLKYNLVPGFVFLNFSFPEYSKKRIETSELQVSVYIYLHKDHKNVKTEKTIRKLIIEQLETKKIESFNRFKI